MLAGMLLYTAYLHHNEATLFSLFKYITGYILAIIININAEFEFLIYFLQKCNQACILNEFNPSSQRNAYNLTMLYFKTIIISINFHLCVKVKIF